MNFGSHWGFWAMAIVALIVGLFLIVSSRRNKKWNWAAAGVLALLLAVVMFVDGWRVWPTQTASCFIQVVNHGSYDEAKEFLREPGQWTITDDGGVTILAEDSSKITLTPDELPLVAGGRKTPVSTRALGEVLGARKKFTIATAKKSNDPLKGVKLTFG